MTACIADDGWKPSVKSAARVAASYATPAAKGSERTRVNRSQDENNSTVASGWEALNASAPARSNGFQLS